MSHREMRVRVAGNLAMMVANALPDADRERLIADLSGALASAGPSEDCFAERSRGVARRISEALRPFQPAAKEAA